MTDVKLKSLWMGDDNYILLHQIADWRNDPRIKPTLRSHGETNYSTQKDWVDDIIKDKSCEYFFIFSKVHKQYVGYCGLDKMNFANRTAEISLLISPEYQGRGIGKAAVIELLKKAFDEYNLNLVFADMYANTTNEIFWKKCFFLFEGKLRDRKYYKNKYWSSIIMSITKGEFYDKIHS